MPQNNLKNYFKNENLLDRSLTHRSWVNEHPGIRESNERLEFLGDAVLEFAVSQTLYAKFPKKEEGFLTALRSSLVNTQNLASVAKKLKLGSALHLSKGEEEGGGRENPSLLADTVEAIIGAIFIDQDLEKVYDFLKLHIFSQISDKASSDLKDAKSKLQEHIQAQGKPAPRYIVVEESGPDHAKEFIIEATMDGKALAKGKGRNKSEAEQEAAKEALKSLL